MFLWHTTKSHKYNDTPTHKFVLSITQNGQTHSQRADLFLARETKLYSQNHHVEEQENSIGIFGRTTCSKIIWARRISLFLNSFSVSFYLSISTWKRFKFWENRPSQNKLWIANDVCLIPLKSDLKNADEGSDIFLLWTKVKELIVSSMTQLWNVHLQHSTPEKNFRKLHLPTNEIVR